MLAPVRRLVAVEERALLGVAESGAVALGPELRCREGDRDAGPVQEHVVGVDDALGRDDVLVDGLEAVFAAVRRGARSTSPRWCSAAVLASSTTSGTRSCGSSRSGQSRPPASRISSTEHYPEVWVSSTLRP